MTYVDLSERLLTRVPNWRQRGAMLQRVVYCTAFIDGNIHKAGHQRQKVYVAALDENGSIDHIEEGRSAVWVKEGMLARKGKRGRPVVHTSRWPVTVEDSKGEPFRNARFMVSYLREEEKATDLNVASHLRLDVLIARVDAAIVISNDSDLWLPIRLARERVPVGTVNPSTNPTAGDLQGVPAKGPGAHWWRRQLAPLPSSTPLPHRWPRSHVRRAPKPSLERRLRILRRLRSELTSTTIHSSTRLSNHAFTERYSTDQSPFY